MALPSRIDAVFFDVGGPLYPDASYADAVLTALDEIRAERGLGPADRAEFRRIYEDVRTKQSGSLRNDLAEAFLGPDTRVALHERTAAHWVHPDGTLQPDVLPLLQQLHGHVHLGVLANQERAAVDALERDGVAKFIDVWGISAIVGHEKPSPEFFQWALDKAGTDPGHAVHVGNRLDKDVRPARALGLGTVWVMRGEAPECPTADQRAEADLAVPDLIGLEKWLLTDGPSGGRGE